MLFSFVKTAVKKNVLKKRGAEEGGGRGAGVKVSMTICIKMIAWKIAERP